MEKRIIKTGLILILTVNFYGCGTIRDHFDGANPKRVLFENWQEKIADTFINGDYQNYYNELGCSTHAEGATQERNKQLDKFILGVDSYYYRNKNSLITGKGMADTAFDIIQLGLTGAASFAGGGTPNLLAAIATAINGSKISIDKNILADHSTLLIASKMDQLRLSKIIEITQKKESQDCAQYSLDAAMKDGIDYYYAGTVNGALLAIFAETSNQMKAAEVKRDTLVKKQFDNIQKQRTLDIQARENAQKREALSIREKEKKLDLKYRE
ncbi:hypothetical protein [Methylobacter sp. YRD-M1]|uniref:hypothetical protein n=1 Tax=Methylobacter sp. YRD-M1 TaxID=2911520 RepID=UPI00227C0B17|nr:hypothetical protein [Methylobacter sp. YRD-M1]WAK00758.1 hypothetical protein LZ558_12975 [Methylobacter sp. YRD-M1]